MERTDLDYDAAPSGWLWSFCRQLKWFQRLEFGSKACKKSLQLRDSSQASSEKREGCACWNQIGRGKPGIVGLGNWDCEQGKMLYPDARFWFKVTEHLWWEGSQILQPLLIVLFLSPTISFTPWNLLINHFFLLLDPDAKSSEINGKFSVDLVICSLCPSKFSVFELDDVYTFFFAGIDVKETASLNCWGNLKFVLKWVLFQGENNQHQNNNYYFKWDSLHHALQTQPFSSDRTPSMCCATQPAPVVFLWLLSISPMNLAWQWHHGAPLPVGWNRLASAPG